MQTQLVKKTAIMDSGDFNLSANRYLEKVEINSEFDIVSLNDFITFLPKSKRKSGDGQENGDYNFFVSSQTKIKKFDTFDYIDESIILGTGGQASIHIDKEFCTSADTFIFKSKDQSVLTNKFIYHMLRGNINILEQGFRGGGLKHLSKDYVKNINIPLPPLEIQEQIVKEIEGYQQIIDGCRQVVENYKPVIDIDPSWEKTDLQDVCEIVGGGTPSRKEEHYWNGNIKWLSCKHLDENGNVISHERISEEGLLSSSSKLIKSGSTILVNRVSLGKVVKIDEDFAINQDLTGLWSKDETKLNPKFLFMFLYSIRNIFVNAGQGLGVKGVSRAFIKEQKISIPSIEIQNKIVEKLEQEKKVIEGNKELIKIYENKINARINKVWSDN